MNHKTFISVAGIIAMVAGLSACGTVREEHAAVTDKTIAKIKQSEESGAKIGAVITTTNSAWLMGDAVSVTAPVPTALKQHVTYHPVAKVNLVEVATYIQSEYGVAVDTLDVQSVSQGSSTSSTPTPLGAGAAAAAPMLPSAASFMGQVANRQSVLPTMNVNYTGELQGLLDYVGNSTGVFWKWADGRVRFFRTETKFIDITAVARKTIATSALVANAGSTSGVSTSNSGSSSSSSSSGITSNGGISNGDTYSLDPWGDLEKIAKVIGGTSGGSEVKVTANPSLSSLAVSGTPPQIRKIEEWAKSLNEKQSQQVSITATLYTVDLTNEDFYQWDPTVVFSKVSSVFGATIAGPSGATTQSTLTPGSIGVSVTNANSSLNGTTLAMKALSTVGKITNTTQQTVVTLNGQQTPLQIGKTKGFIYQSTTTTTASVGSSSSITPGSVTVGFTAMFTPQVVNGKILLSMDMINSQLDDLKDRTSGNSTIQTADTSASFFKQSVLINSGDTLMLTGVTQDGGQTNDTGVGSPSFKLLGGGVGASTTKKMIAIVISAKVF